MATSGNTIKQLSRDDIINAALRKLVVLQEGQAPNANQITTASEALNIIVSEFRTLGMSVWARTALNITLVTGQKDYVIGVGQVINVPYPTYIYDINLEIPPYDSQIEMQQMAIIDFNQLPNAGAGTPVNYNYKPGINIGTLSIWPTPDASVPALTRMVVTYQRPLEVFDAALDTPDFPQEWGNALIYNLAFVLCDEYGVPDSKASRIEKQADKHLGTALSNSNEQGSMFFQPDWQVLQQN